MRSTNKHPHWLRGVRLFGFEDENDATDDENDDGAEGSDDDEDGDSSDDSEGGSGDTAGLKSALRKERKARREAEKRAKAAEKATNDRNQQEEEDLAAAKDSLTKEQQKTARLAAKFATNSVNDEIRKQARAMKFLDEDVAVALVDRDVIEYDQDDDDPASVKIDTDSVKEALDDLKKAKPHLLVAEGSDEPTGGKFGGSRQKKTGKETEAEQLEHMKRLYPAMRNRP